jgi:hypothetical protein
LKVWISYSQKDKDFVNRLKLDLARFGIQAMVADELVRPGESWVERISSSILDADCILIVLSSQSAHSEWMTSEIAFALSAKEAGRTGQLIPIILDRKTSLPPFLADIRYLDFSEASLYENNLATLALTISALKTTETRATSKNLKLDFLNAQRELLVKERTSLDLRRQTITLRLALLFTSTLILGILAVLITSYLSVPSPTIIFTILSFVVGIIAGAITQSFVHSRKLRKEARK